MTARVPSTPKPILTSKLVVKATVEYKALDLDGIDDPIAQAINARSLIGSNPQEQLKEADAKKAGVQLVKTFKLVASKGLDLIDLITKTAEKTVDKAAETKTATAPKSTATKVIAPSKTPRPAGVKQPDEEKKTSVKAPGVKKQEEEKKVGVKPTAITKKQADAPKASASNSGAGLTGDLS